MEEQVFKHVCKFCSKGFLCGRSLGGHMRSHMNNINNHSLEADVNGTGYILRENPKKTWRLSEDSSVDDKVCKECGQGFQSWKALFGHMKCHSDKEMGTINSLEEQDCWINGDEKLVLDSQSDNETETGVPNKRRRSKRRTRYIGTSANCSTSMSEIEQKQEQEEVALSLMMLSRDVRYWVGLNSVVDSSDNGSMLLKAGIQIKSKSGFDFTRVDRSNMKKSQTYDDVLESEFCKDPHKRSKFECTTCKKIFHSYQALGGHRASHNKGKGCFGSDSSDTTTESGTNTAAADSKVVKSDDNEISIANLFSERYGVVKENKGHECPICLKVFQSGQALGGHKRSHLVAEAKENRTRMIETRNPIPEIREFLDLNMPAPVEEGSSVHIGFKTWWVGTSYKHEPLLGLNYN